MRTKRNLSLLFMLVHILLLSACVIVVPAPTGAGDSQANSALASSAPAQSELSDEAGYWLGEAQQLAKRIVGYCFSLEDLEGRYREEISDSTNSMVEGFVCSFMYCNQLQGQQDYYLQMAAPRRSEDGTQWVTECDAVTRAVARCFDMPESEIRLSERLQYCYNSVDQCFYYPVEVGNPSFFSMVDPQAQFVSEGCIVVSFSLWSNLSYEFPENHGNYVVNLSIIQKDGEHFLRFDSFLPA